MSRSKKAFIVGVSLILGMLVISGCLPNKQGGFTCIAAPLLAKLKNQIASPQTKVTPNTPQAQANEDSFTQKVSPSKESQRFSTPGGIDVTVPGGVLAKDTTLSVKSINDYPDPTFAAPYKALGTYEISLGDIHEFDSALMISLKYDTARLTGSQNPENSLTAAYFDEGFQSWMVLPSMVDTQNKQLIVLTDHLSKIQYGQWASTDKSSGLPGLRGLLPNQFQSVGLSMKYGNRTVQGNAVVPVGHVLFVVAESNIPEGAYYIWKLNGKVVAQGLFIREMSALLTGKNLAHTVHLQVCTEKDGPVLAETSRTLKMMTLSNDEPLPSLDIEPACGLKRHSLRIGKRAYGFTGIPYCFTASLYNCPPDIVVSWDLGDGLKGEGTTVTHTWKEAESYGIKAHLERGGERIKGLSHDDDRTYDLFILDKPTVKITSPNTGTKIILGDDCEFIAESKPFPAAYSPTYLWEISNGEVRYQTEQGAFQSFFHKFKDIGKYTVKISLFYPALNTEVMLAQDQIEVTVLCGLKIYPEKLDAQVGTYSFTCRADPSYKNPTFIWDIDGSPKQNGPKNTFTTDFKWAGTGRVTVTLVDGGKQLCSATAPVTIRQAAPTPTPVIPTPTPAPTGTGWYLDGPPVIKKNALPADNCVSFGLKLSVGDGSASGSHSWKDCSGGSKCSGTYTGTVTWTPPPSFMKPGSKVNFTMSENTAAQNTCGEYGVNSGGWVKVDGTTIVEVRPTLTPTATGSYPVRTGSPGEKLVVEATVKAANMYGFVTYNYTYK